MTPALPIHCATRRTRLVWALAALRSPSVGSCSWAAAWAFLSAMSLVSRSTAEILVGTSVSAVCAGIQEATRSSGDSTHEPSRFQARAYLEPAADHFPGPSWH